MMQSAVGADVAVIGGGVAGLACAAELARRGRSVVVLERHEQIGTETSSRNSEVVHAGIYYPAESLKARSCIEGRELLYRRCERDAIGHARLGKLIVATSTDQLATLGRLARQAIENQAGGITELEGEQVRRLEPRVRAIAAVWSTNSGIVDAHALMRSYQAELEAKGGTVVTRTRVVALTTRSHGWSIRTLGADDEPFDLDCELIVNAAGLEADSIAAMAGLDVDALGWRIRFCKGDYFGVAPGLGRLASRLVYPVPNTDGAGLGVHLTIDLAGRFKLGPDAHYVDEIGYRVDPAKAAAFAEAAQRFLPEIDASQLTPEMAGVRPRLQGPGDAFRDFVLAESSAWGAAAMVHLIGIESPGLTAAGALARMAADLCEGRSHD
jgi:L-2-hydroxyglutarate oxidase LhgO